jgi:hypothetical protein
MTEANGATQSKLPLKAMTDDLTSPYRTIATIYHAYLTGLILSVSLHKGATAAGEAVFRVYRQHHKNKFVSSFEKLGLSGKPDAVASAEYHYLSNSIGGVRVEFMPESDKKAWVRFAHPRWIYEGAALCGMPIEVSRGMLNGWYAENGVSLGNPRLGFVCVSEDMDGGFGLAGYFLEHDRDLEPHERLSFAPGETPPPFDPALAPPLDTASWPEERLAKANRNYAMEPVRLMIPALIELLGKEEATFLARKAGKLIGLQYYEQTAAALGVTGDEPKDFGRLFQSLAQSQGDECEWSSESDGVHIRQSTWRFAKDIPSLSTGVFEAWNGLWEGLLISHNRFLVLEPLARMDYGDDAFEWRVRRAS